MEYILKCPKCDKDMEFVNVNLIDCSSYYIGFTCKNCFDGEILLVSLNSKKLQPKIQLTDTQKRLVKSFEAQVSKYIPYTRIVNLYTKKFIEFIIKEDVANMIKHYTPLVEFVIKYNKLPVVYLNFTDNDEISYIVEFYENGENFNTKMYKINKIC